MKSACSPLFEFFYCRNRSRINDNGGQIYGFLFLAVFALLSAIGDGHIFGRLRRSIPREFGSAMGRHSTRRLLSPISDPDLYLSESRLRQYMVRRSPDRRNTRIFWRRPCDESPPQTKTGSIGHGPPDL